MTEPTASWPKAPRVAPLWRTQAAAAVTATTQVAPTVVETPTARADWFDKGAAHTTTHVPASPALLDAGRGPLSTRLALLRGVDALPSADEVLRALRADLHGKMRSVDHTVGWPMPVREGLLFVSPRGNGPTLNHYAGADNGWQPERMHDDGAFSFTVRKPPPGTPYKLTDGHDVWQADPSARAVKYDERGLMSLSSRVGAGLEHIHDVGDDHMSLRMLRIWMPEKPPRAVAYVTDGQNLFDPGAKDGCWRLSHGAPDDVMIVGIDHGANRIEEYTHCKDTAYGKVTGGGVESYARYLEGTVRPLVDQVHGEPEWVALLGSSLGGNASLYIAQRTPGAYDYVAAMSSTLWWGSGTGEKTVPELYLGAAQNPVRRLYLDSGGGPDTGDNYTVNKDFHAALVKRGAAAGEGVTYRWAENAKHENAVWGARAVTPLAELSALARASSR